MTKGSINILEGSTFVTSDERGDIEGTPVKPEGLFAFDTRFLSRWRLTADGKSPAVLSTDDVHYYMSQFFLAPSTGTTYIDSPLSLVRRRSIHDRMREVIGVYNHRPEPRSMQLKIEFAADFADLFEVKDQLDKKGRLYQRVEDTHVVLGYERDEYRRETWIVPAGAPCTMGESSLTFDIDLAPHGQWNATLEVIPVLESFSAEVSRDGEARDEAAALDLRSWLNEAPIIECDWRDLEHAYQRSLVDLAELRLHLPMGEPGEVIPAAGLPWFMSLFGRDSLITAYQSLACYPDLSRMTLKLLAAMQGTAVDDFRDMEPGKMPHEMRFGELTAFEERPHSPYYGSADATPLWLILLDEYVRWTGREDVARDLEPAARAALRWMDEYGDRDGDGYIEYERRNKETGLENQCWKDSWDSIVDSKGQLAKFPRATCELQGYMYDGKLRGARLAREVWDDTQLAERLEREAGELKARFNRDFWVADRGFFALALDGDKKQVDSLTSNIGHLLWSGIADEDKPARCAEHLMSDAMFSGWGVRTMAQGEASYNPIGYHVGTVWPHDNSIIAMGLFRYGYRKEAARIAQAQFEAAPYFDYRLPEAFAGYPRNLTHYPAEYPTACSPQAWATGAPLLFIRAMMGMQPRGAQLAVDAVLPERIGFLRLHRVPGRWGRTEAAADAADIIMSMLGSAAGETPTAVRELFSAMKDRVAPTLGPETHASIRFDLTDGSSWRIAVDGGRLMVAETRDPADCELELSEQTLLSVLSGQQNARTALLAGKIKVRGDMNVATRFARAGLACGTAEPPEERRN